MKKLHFFLIPIFAIELLVMFMPFWTKYYASSTMAPYVTTSQGNDLVHSITRGYECTPAYIVFFAMATIGCLGLINKNKVTAIIALVISGLTFIFSLLTLGLMSLNLNLNFWGPRTYTVTGTAVYLNILLSLCLLLVMIFHLAKVVKKEKTVKPAVINDDLLDSI